MLFSLLNFASLVSFNSPTECTLDYDRCQVHWFSLSLLQTTDGNDHSTKPMA